jgi:hypothetical protein
MKRKDATVLVLSKVLAGTSCQHLQTAHTSMSPVGADARIHRGRAGYVAAFYKVISRDFANGQYQSSWKQ